MTTWTSSAPITLRVRCRCWMPSDTCSTWWSERTTTPASPNHMIRCAGSAATLLLLTPLRSSLKSFSVLLHSRWERSFAKEKATIISVSVTIAWKCHCLSQLVLFFNIFTEILQPHYRLCGATLTRQCF